MKVVVENVTAGYDTRIVLRNVSMKAEEGKVTAIVGPNGAGKTTLLRVIAGIVKPRRGFVRIGEYLLPGTRPADIARLVGFVQQGQRGRPILTVVEYVALGRVLARGGWRIRGEDLDAAERALRLLGIEELAERRVDELSGGQRQLVDIAQVLAKDPKVLLLDEPTSHLDVRRQVEVLEVISKLAREGKTVIVVLHDINMVLDYADHVVLLGDGTVIDEGEPLETLKPEKLSKLYGIEFRLVNVDGVPRLVPTRARWST